MVCTTGTSQLAKALLLLCLSFSAESSSAERKGDNALSSESSTSKETNDLEKEETTWNRPAVDYGGGRWSSSKGWVNPGYSGNLVSGGYGGYRRGFSDYSRDWSASYGNSKGWYTPGAGRPVVSGWPNYAGREFLGHGNEYPRTKSWNPGYASGSYLRYPYGNRWPVDRSIGASKGLSGTYGSYGGRDYANPYPVSDYWSGSYGNQKGWPRGGFWSDRRSYRRYPSNRYGDYEDRMYGRTGAPGNFKGSQFPAAGDYGNYWSGTRGYGYGQGFQRPAWK